MIYFTRGDETAVAETDESAARLERDGFTRCTPVEHELVWAERDRKRRLALAREGAQEVTHERASPTPAAPASGPAVERGGKVYPSGWKN